MKNASSVRLFCWSGWAVAAILSAGIAIALGPNVAVERALDWLDQHDKTAAWLGVVVTGAAVFLSARLGASYALKHQARLAAERLVAIYVITCAAGNQVHTYDRLHRRSSVGDSIADRVAAQETDARRRDRIGLRWDAWIINRLIGLADQLENYQPSGVEPEKFLQHLQTVQGRLRWLAQGVGNKVSDGSITADEAHLLEVSAYDVVYALLEMKKGLDQVTDTHALPLEKRCWQRSAAGPYVLEKQGRLECWNKVGEL